MKRLKFPVRPLCIKAPLVCARDCLCTSAAIGFMEGSSGGMPEQAPAQIAVTRTSFWNLHKAYVIEQSRKADEVSRFGQSMKMVFQLDFPPNEKALRQSYCNIFTDSFARVFLDIFARYSTSGRLSPMHARMLSGLILQRIKTGMLHVVVCLQHSTDDAVLCMIEHNRLGSISDIALRDGLGFKRITLSSLGEGTPQYQLVSFKDLSRAMTIGDQHEAAPERVSLRHKKGKSKSVKKARRKSGSSGSDAVPDLEAVREDAASLVDSPRAGGATGDGGASSATGGSHSAGQPGVARRQQLSLKERTFVEDADA